MSRPSKYPPEFRARGVQLYRDSEGRTIAEGARELGVGAGRSASGCARTRRTVVRPRRSRPRRSWRSGPG